MDNNPFEAPTQRETSAHSDPDALYVRDGVVFASIHAQLPQMCAKCGSRDIVISESKTFSWSPLWARLTILLSPLVAIVAILLTRKSSTLAVSLCAVDLARVRRNTPIGWGGLISGIVLLLLSILLVDSLQQGFFAMVGGGVLAILIAIWAFSQAVVVRPKYIDKIEARYVGVHADVVAEIERRGTSALRD